MIRLIYFARLRDVLGSERESVEIPTEARTVGDIRSWLGTRGDLWRREVAENPALCIALNHDYADDDAAIRDGDEIAFFPPVTGG